MNDTKLTGRSIIGAGRGSETAKIFRAFDPGTGEAVGPDFFSAAPQKWGGFFSRLTSAICITEPFGQRKRNILRNSVQLAHAFSAQ